MDLQQDTTAREVFQTQNDRDLVNKENTYNTCDLVVFGDDGGTEQRSKTRRGSA